MSKNSDNTTLNIENAYKAWNIEYEPRFSDLSWLDKVKHLLGWSILAANAHNAQPWKVSIDSSKKEISVSLDPRRLLEKADPEHRQAVVSIGCFIENLFIACESYKVLPRMIIANSIEHILSEPIVKIIISDTKEIPDETTAIKELTVIKERRITRGKYIDGKEIPLEFFNSVKMAGTSLGIDIKLITDQLTRVAIAELQYMANRTVIALPGFRNELGQYVLLNSDRSTSIGMPGYSFGLSDVVTEKFKTDLESPGILNPDWAAGFAAADRDGFRSSPCVVIGIYKTNSIENWITSGRFFQRVALIAQKMGLATAYNAAIIESKVLNNMLRIRLGTTNKPLTVFRVGYSENIREHSPRLSVNEISMESKT